MSLRCSGLMLDKDIRREARQSRLRQGRAFLIAVHLDQEHATLKAMQLAVEELGETGMRTFAALSAAAMAALTPSIAWAEANWVFVASSGAGTHTAYIDTTSIRRTGSIVRFWQRSVFLNNKDGWEESKSLKEDDCENGRTRILQLSIYYVDGRIRTNNNPDDWSYVTPGTIEERTHEVACQK
jgi:hypothetical protein